MDVLHLSSLLAKAFWSAAIVLGLAAVAERVSTRIAGILAGAPQNALLVYFFVGRDMGTDFVVASVPHGIAAFTATIAFAVAYYLMSARLPRFGAIGASVVAIAVFLAAAAILVRIPFSWPGAAVLTLCAILLANWLFRRIVVVPVMRPVRYSIGLFLLRGGSAVVLIVAVISVAEMLGTRWTGLLTGFPAIFWPTLIIIHLTYGSANTHAVIRNFPLGVGSIVLYILSVQVTYPGLGLYLGTVASLALSIAYLGLLMFWQPLLRVVQLRRIKQGP